MPELTIYRRPDFPAIYQMLFISAKGRRGRADFETQPFYIELPW